MCARVANFSTGDGKGFNVDSADTADSYRSDRRDRSDRSEPSSNSYVYSDLVGYQTSDIRLLWTIITQTINPPPHPPLWCSTPPPNGIAPSPVALPVLSCIRMYGK